MRKRRTYIADGWAAFRRQQVPVGADQKEVEHLRRAFFAGAATNFYTLLMALDDGQEATEADLARMDDLQTEIDTFGAELDLSVFGPVKRH